MTQKLLGSDFTFFNRFLSPIYTFWFVFLVHSNGQVHAQCQMICNDNVQASLNENCENEITWDVLLEGNPPSSCINDFVVEVLGTNGLPLPGSPFVTVSEINKIVVGRIIHAPSGQTCQTNILVQDKLPPTLHCIDTLLSCFHDTTPSVMGYPVFYDNCTVGVDISHFDQNTTFNCTLTDTVLIINRQWTAKDSSGNAATCWQKIYVERPPLDSIQFPVNLDNLSAPPLYCSSMDTSTSLTGVPLYDSLFIDSIWGFYIDYEDVTVPICDGSFTVFREWTVYDGCRLTSLTEEQAINVMDTLPPQLICPANFTVSVANNQCVAMVNLPQPATSDSCSAIVNVSLEGSFGWIQGMTIPNLERGVYPTTCHASDDCGNVSSCQFVITVEDNIPPVAVGISNPIVSLLPQGTTYLPAITFNGGSWDNCDGLTFKARRMDSSNCPGNDGTGFDVEVPFYCCDAGELVDIELQVEDASGNTSTVNTFVQVKDNIDPKITCPDNLTIDCSEDYNDLEITGEASVVDNCSGYELSFENTMDMDACGEGTLQRTWKVEDIANRTDDCIQTIIIKNQTPFYINPSNPNDPNDGVIWPKNYISTTCGNGLSPDDLPTEYAFPVILSDSFCQQIAVSYADTWLSQPNNACIEILRAWTIVDWCQFNPVTFDGRWQFGQVIRIQNSKSPVIVSSCDFEEFCSDDAECETGKINLSIDAEDDCNDIAQLKFIYAIDFYDDGTNNLTGSGQTANVDIPLGVHRIYWEVEDGCHNKTVCDYLFSVVDCKKPSPVCKELIAQIMDSALPTVDILAHQFNAGSSDNCTANSDLVFSFSDNVLDTIKTFSCLNTGLNDLEIWVTDEMGNQDFCTVEVDIQSNNNACSSAAVVSGKMALINGDETSLVKVSLNNAASTDSMTTDITGAYLFDNVATGNDYTISPIKNTNPLNGVTTYDLVLITRHILGVEILDSPYKIIAADANRSGTVTTLDMVFIRKLILNIDQSFPNNYSWRFVDKNYQFVNPLNPTAEAFPEVVNINNLSGDFTADFIAIKIGDVNNSVDATE